MKTAVIIDGVRIPVGSARPTDGYYRDVRADDLAAHVMKGLVAKTGIDPAIVEDVYFGCVQQQSEQGFNMARTAALIAGFPVESAACTVNRLCASGLTAINSAARAIMTGCEDVHVVGGVEHMHHYPMDKDVNPSPRMGWKNFRAAMMMGITAEYVAMKYFITREEQDEFAYGSHMKAHEATEKGLFKDEVLPTWGLDAAGHRQLMTVDQTIRPDTNLESLAKIPPAFNPKGGIVTAGNSSPLSVGAAALLMMSEERAKQLGLKPKVRIRSMAVAGCEPCEMGIGPAKAAPKALERAGLGVDDLDAIELNEAFASQSVAVLRLTGFDPAKVNTRGGAIALGHPLGCSGARIMVTLIHRMSQESKKRGMATLCVGGGMGEATIVEAC
ncbi:MAG: acetyl-CoA C-acyltransferase [Phycisphaerae bacterium]|nr:acetyl-CoA C-acyltransferase [Phycisphaerae bacterium]